MRWLIAILVMAIAVPVFAQYKLGEDCDSSYIDTTLVDSLSFYTKIIIPRLDSLIIFYVDTVAWKQIEESYITGPKPNKDGIVLSYAIIVTENRWIPIIETTYVASYPIDKKVKRERWQYQIK